MSGYEKLAGLMTKHSEVATFQRFDFLNTLNILYLQAELVNLEHDLRGSMREDIESGNNLPSEYPDDHESLNGVENEDIESGEIEGISGKGGVNEKTPESKVDRKSTSKATSSINERIESARDWWYLSNMDDSRTWEIMLKAREKLKEYNEAVLRQTEMKAQHSPNACDLEFLRRWFKDKNMGDFPLIGRDSTLWETSRPFDLIALKARKGEDPLGTLFLSRVFLWWHNCIGHRIKKPLDEEAQYFEYGDKYVLRTANVFGSIISSALLVGSILALYFVNNMLARLGIIAALTQVFSLVLILVTSARKVEVFGATAAFVAVQVVFVGSTSTVSGH